MLMACGGEDRGWAAQRLAAVRRGSKAAAGKRGGLQAQWHLPPAHPPSASGSPAARPLPLASSPPPLLRPHLVYAAVVLKQELAGGLHEGVLGGHQEEVGVEDLAGAAG